MWFTLKKHRAIRNIYKNRYEKYRINSKNNETCYHRVRRGLRSSEEEFYNFLTVKKIRKKESTLSASHFAKLWGDGGIFSTQEHGCGLLLFLCGCGEAALISSDSVWVQRSGAQIGADL